MPCLPPYKMAKIRTEYIVFWLIILVMLSIAIWKIFGSPTDTSTLIAVIIFVSMSEILLWKAIFNMDKNIAGGFTNIKNNINNINTKIDNLIGRKAK